MNQRTFPEPLTASIAAVERDTGIGKDTLRIWERRYGFPQPGRDAYGERSYSLDQVEKLRAIKRLLDQGHRPGRIVALPIEALQRLSQGQSSTPQKMAISTTAPELRDFMACILGHDAEGLRRKLHQAVAAMGHFRFVTELVAPLNGMVGDAWMRGELQIFEEHLYTESITSVLRQAINSIPQPIAQAHRACQMVVMAPPARTGQDGRRAVDAAGRNDHGTAGRRATVMEMAHGPSIRSSQPPPDGTDVKPGMRTAEGLAPSPGGFRHRQRRD